MIEKWTSDKKSRRAAVEKQYEFIQIIGDNLGDFLDNIKNYELRRDHSGGKNGSSHESLQKMVDRVVSTSQSDLRILEALYPCK